MASNIKIAYEGILSQPIEYRSLATSIRDFRTLASKIDAFCLWLGVEPQSVDRDLVLILARRYVPGFQIGKAKEPTQKKWDDIGLARLWITFKEARPHFETDKDAAVDICRRRDSQSPSQSIKPVWLLQLLTKARTSPLVQLIESGNPSDNKFAQEFLARHGR